MPLVSTGPHSNDVDGYASRQVCIFSHDMHVLLLGVFVKALVRWATGKKLTNRLPKLSLITPPPFEQRDSCSSYGAVRTYSEVLYNLWGPMESDLSHS